MGKQHAEQLSNYLQHEGWDFQQMSNSAFKCTVPFELEDPESPFTGTFLMQDGVCVFLIAPHYTIPKKNHSKVERLFSLLNHWLTGVYFMLDVNSGWVGSKAVMLFDEEQPFNAVLLDNLISINMDSMMEYELAIRMVGSGQCSPEQALATIAAE